MKFIYTGGGDTSYYGYDFVDGIPTEVTSPRAIAKLTWNKFFTEIHDESASEIPAFLGKPLRKTRHL